MENKRDTKGRRCDLFINYQPANNVSQFNDSKIYNCRPSSGLIETLSYLRRSRNVQHSLQTSHAIMPAGCHIC